MKKFIQCSGQDFGQDFFTNEDGLRPMRGELERGFMEIEKLYLEIKASLELTILDEAENPSSGHQFEFMSVENSFEPMFVIEGVVKGVSLRNLNTSMRISGNKTSFVKKNGVEQKIDIQTDYNLDSIGLRTQHSD